MAMIDMKWRRQMHGYYNLMIMMGTHHDTAVALLSSLAPSVQLQDLLAGTIAGAGCEIASLCLDGSILCLADHVTGLVDFDDEWTGNFCLIRFCYYIIM